MADGCEGAEIVVLSSDSEEKRLKSEPHANGTSSYGSDVKSEPTAGDSGVKSVSKLSLKRKREISGTANNGENTTEPARSVCAPNTDQLSSSSGPAEMVDSTSSPEGQTKTDTVMDSTRAEATRKSFSKFVHLCSTLTKDKDVLKFLEKRFNAADPIYLSSQTFLDFLSKRTEKLKECGKKEVFVHMKAVIDDLKANSKSESGSEKGKRKSRRKGDQSGQDSSTEFSDKSDTSSAKRFKLDDVSVGKDDKSEQNGHGSEKSGPGKSEDDTGMDTEESAAHSKGTLDSDLGKASSAGNLLNSSGDKDAETGQSAQASSSNEDPAESERKAKKRQKQIRRLENLLAIVSKEIKRLEAKEVSLDDLDDEDSTYIQEDRLKKRFNTIWNKICELKGEEIVTGREVERTIKFKGTRFPEVNRRIMKFLRRNDAFPDFHDILAIVQKTNRKENLRLPPRHVHDLAKEAFTEIGDRFQRRRQRDLVQNFGSYLTDTFDPTKDPAKEDAELQQKLRDNRMHGKRRLDEVLEKYTRKQYELNLDGDTAQGSDTEDPPVRGVSDVETEEDLDEDEMEDEEQLENSQVIEKVLEKDDSEEEEAMREITIVKPRKSRKRFLPAFPDSEDGGPEEGAEKMAGIEGGKQEGSPVPFHEGGSGRNLQGGTSGIGRVENEEEKTTSTTTTATNEPQQMGVTEETMTEEPVEKEATSTDPATESSENIDFNVNGPTDTAEIEDSTTNDVTRIQGNHDMTSTDPIEILSSAESDVTDDSANWNNDENEAACKNGRTPERHPLSRFSIDDEVEIRSSQDSDCIAIETVDLEQGLCSSQNVESPENDRNSRDSTAHSKVQTQRIVVDPLRLQDLRIKVSSILAGDKSCLSRIKQEPSSSHTPGADSPAHVPDSSQGALSQDTVSSSSGPLIEYVDRPNSPDIIVLSDSE